MIFDVSMLEKYRINHSVSTLWKHYENWSNPQVDSVNSVSRSFTIYCVDLADFQSVGPRNSTAQCELIVCSHCVHTVGLCFFFRQGSFSIIPLYDVMPFTHIFFDGRTHKQVNVIFKTFFYIFTHFVPLFADLTPQNSKVIHFYDVISLIVYSFVISDNFRVKKLARKCWIREE